MPGRVSTRTSTASRISHKSSSQTLSSRRSTTSHVSPIPDEGLPSPLRARLCDAFGDAQNSTAGHRKLVVGLRKIQEACIYEPEGSEDDFNVEFMRCVIRLMAVKKSEGIGDKLVRFIGSFLRYSSEKDMALIPESRVDETQSMPETPSLRLTSHVLSILLQFLTSKEKTVRFRSTQLIAHIVNSLDSIDDEYYHLVKMGLLKRVRDKEPMIRVQAVLGLGRLAGNEDDEEENEMDSDDEDASGLLVKLVEVLQNDPSADVRRSLLLNLPLTPSTLPYLLERARDMDPATRKALYSRLLPALGDFRHLSLSMREKLLRWGLRDRDEHVRKATARLFRECWIQDCAGSKPETVNGKPAEAPDPSMDALLELLERIDVVNSGVEEGVAPIAMREFWEGRPDYQDEVKFEDPFWDSLTTESAFMARCFNDFCRQKGPGKYESLVEDKMPEVTKLAFILQRYLNTLVELLKRNNAQGEGEELEESVELEFIVEQLLHIAKTLDYTDEVGRRKTFALLRETLAIAELPDEITKLVVEILRDICGGEVSAEREFCGVVLEAIAEVHDAISPDQPPAENEDESFHSARSEISDATPKKSSGADHEPSQEDDEEKAIREIMINMKCLHIAQCMLENVEGGLQQNAHLVTMLNNLVVPAVRSHEAPIRERGLLCLGLCCLLDKSLAEENLTLFLHCFSKGHEALQVKAIQILSDILTTHPSLLTVASPDNGLQKQILKTFSKGLKMQYTPEVQSATTTALCKLMLTSVITDEDILKQAIICYFDPASNDNAGVRQALTYFFPVYCHSRRENMQRMANVAASVVHAVIDLSEDLGEGEEMTSVNTVGNMLIDWTDARKLVVPDEASVSWDEAGRKEVKAVNGDIHLDLAESLLERTLHHSCSKEERKALITMLGKLYVTSNSDATKLHCVNDLVIEAIDSKIAADATSRTALNKLHLAVGKARGEVAKTKAGRKSADETALVEEGEEDVDVDAGTTASASGSPQVTEAMDVVDEDREAPGDGEGEGEEEEEETAVVAGHDETVEPSVAKDSILDELLDDEDSV